MALLRQNERLLSTELERRRLGARFDALFPDDGPLRRELYAKHTEFFEAGLRYRLRCFMAANRVGKSESGGYECTAHLTGRYPKWWKGRRFDKPTAGWVAGKTNITTRDIPQAKLFGKISRKGSKRTFTGTGLVPAGQIGHVSWARGMADLADVVAVRHESGGWSEVGFKSYQQGRGSFEGTERDFIWLDEEPPEDILDECTIRTATTNGLILITFTPLEGMSKTVLQFMPSDMRPSQT